MNIKQVVETFLCIQYKRVREAIREEADRGIFWLTCRLSWASVAMIPGCLDYLSSELSEDGWIPYRTLWFAEEDPLLGVSKPVTVTNIGLTSSGDYILEVIGKRSDRIKKKWEGKYSEKMRGFVTLVWKEKP